METLLALRKREEEERGYTLLEYVAGAAVILGIVLVGLNAMGSGVSTYLTNLGTWAANIQFNQPKQN